MTIPPSACPVYRKGPKGEADLSVRVGYSTRHHEAADAVQYVAARWPESVRVLPLTRIRLFLTMTRHRETLTRLPRIIERVLTERTKHEAGVPEGGSSAVRLALETQRGEWSAYACARPFRRTSSKIIASGDLEAVARAVVCCETGAYLRGPPTSRGSCTSLPPRRSRTSCWHAARTSTRVTGISALRSTRAYGHDTSIKSRC